MFFFLGSKIDGIIEKQHENLAVYKLISNGLYQTVKLQSSQKAHISSSQKFIIYLKRAKPKLLVKMKVLIVFSLFVVAALAAPANDATILKYENDNIGLDSYNFE